MGNLHGRIPSRNTNAQPQPVTLLPTALSTDNQPNLTLSRIQSYEFVYDGATWDRKRTPTTFKTITTITSGNTAIWTPATGKKFRLMGYAIYAPDDVQVTAATDVDVTFQDGTTPIGLGFTFWSPDNTSTSNRHTDQSSPVQLGNGYLSTTANNVLNVNLSVAITLGKIRITVWGTEE